VTLLPLDHAGRGVPTCELDEATPDVRRDRRPVDGLVEQDDDGLVVPESREVLERQIHGAPDPSRLAQRTELVQLSSSLCHERIVVHRADRTLHSD
jgi:hypothetical protein